MYELTLVKEYQTVVGHTQKWLVHVPGLDSHKFGEVLVVDLFRVGGKWHAWTGCFVRRVESKMANSVAETINWLEGNPI